MNRKPPSQSHKQSVGSGWNLPILEDKGLRGPAPARLDSTGESPAWGQVEQGDTEPLGRLERSRCVFRQQQEVEVRFQSPVCSTQKTLD